METTTVNLNTFGWNPWTLSASVGAQGWNPPLSLAAAATPSGDLVRAILAAQSATLMVPSQVKIGPDPTLDDTAALSRWSLDVRFSLIVVESLTKLTFAFDASSSAGHLLYNHGGSARLVSSITRPTLAHLSTHAEGLASTRTAYAAAASQVDAMVAQDTQVDAFFLRSTGLTLDSAPATYLLARAISILANLACQRFKHAFAVPRPGELDPSIVPLLTVPGHASFPGGHATMAGAVEKLLTTIWSQRADPPRLAELAESIANNRVHAGLHYAIDSEAGLKLGRELVDTIAQSVGKPGELPMLQQLWNDATVELSRL